MGYFARLLAGDVDAEDALPGPTDDWWYLNGPGAISLAGVRVNDDSAMKVSTVFAAYRKISSVMACIPLHVRRRRGDGGSDPAPNHPASRLIRSPNPIQTLFQFLQTSEGHVMLRGNSYARVYSGPRGYAERLVPRHPNRMRMVDLDSDGYPVYAERLKNGQEEILTADKVFHVAGPSYDGLLGLSPLKLMMNSVGMALATETYGSRLFANGASPSILLKHPLLLSEEAQTRLANQVQRRTSGMNAHRPLVLEEGMTAEKLAFTSQEAQFLETRDFQVDDLLRFLDVPRVLIDQGTKSSTYASAEQFFLSFVTYCIGPISVMWEQRLTASLITDEDHFFKFSLQGVLRGDSAARGAFYERMLRNRVMTPNEVRALEDLNPAPWGDEPNPIQGAGRDQSSMDGGDGDPPGASAGPTEDLPRDPRGRFLPRS